MTDHSALIERLEAAMSREGKPRGDHMTGAYAAFAVSALEGGDEDQAELASVYDAASRCIANETAMFDALSAVASEAAAALRDIEGERSVEYVIYQDDVMVAGSDSEADIRHYAFVYGQDVQVFKVVSFSSPLPSAPNQAKEAGE